jgi:hypothetical protein
MPGEREREREREKERERRRNAAPYLCLSSPEETGISVAGVLLSNLTADFS